jgi:hypothetical protein
MSCNGAQLVMCANAAALCAGNAAWHPGHLYGRLSAAPFLFIHIIPFDWAKTADVSVNSPISTMLWPEIA